MKECNQIRELMPLGVSEDITPDEIAQLKAHLESCAECRQEFETYRTIRQGLGQLSFAAHDKLLADSGLKISDFGFRISDLPPQRYLWRYASVAAMFLMGIVTGFAGWQAFRTTPPARPEPQITAQTQPLVGAELRPVSEAMEEHLGLPPCQGLVISNLLKESPAEQMGFKTGDIILTINGKPVTSTEFTLGEQGEVRIVRNGVTINIKLTRD
ncbi:MAG: zf-HC2 domain-containing protein [Planctomycetes bacterium]|nr:zf-HC2 domain-containing protein [Planctomycetota bacterium]